MIIFRGWGLLGAGIPVLTAFAIGALPMSLYGDKSAIANIFVALGALVGGALGFLQAPSSREEGYAQVEQLIAAESPEILSQLKNIHTLFYIPMQWFAVGAGVAVFFGALSNVLR